MILFAALGLTALVVLYVLFECFTCPSLSMIHGPKFPSLIFDTVFSLFLHNKYSLSLYRQHAQAVSMSSWWSRLCMAESIWQGCLVQGYSQSESIYFILLGAIFNCDLTNLRKINCWSQTWRLYRRYWACLHTIIQGHPIIRLWPKC